MKNFLQSAAPIILAALAFIFFHLATRERKQEDKGDYKGLQMRYDSLDRVSRVKDSLLIVERLKFDSLYAVKSSLGKKVSDLTKTEHEKTIAIDSVNPGELYGIFSGFNINP